MSPTEYLRSRVSVPETDEWCCDPLTNEFAQVLEQAHKYELRYATLRRDLAALEQEMRHCPEWTSVPKWADRIAALLKQPRPDEAQP